MGKGRSFSAAPCAPFCAAKWCAHAQQRPSPARHLEPGTPKIAMLLPGTRPENAPSQPGTRTARERERIRTWTTDFPQRKNKDSGSAFPQRKIRHFSARRAGTQLPPPQARPAAPIACRENPLPSSISPRRGRCGRHSSGWGGWREGRSGKRDARHPCQRLACTHPLPVHLRVPK